MIITGAIKPRVQLYAIVRDAQGKPKIDGDPRKLNESIKGALTAEEYAEACAEYDSKMSMAR